MTSTADRQAAADRFRISGQQLTDILDNITDGFFTCDLDWRLTFINRVAAAMLAAPADTLIGRQLWEAVPELSATGLGQACRRAIAEGIPIEHEDYYPPRHKWFAIRAYPSDAGISVYMLDITELKKINTEDRLHNQNKILEERVRERTQELENAQTELEHAYNATLEAWSRLLDLRDNDTEGHSQRVTSMSLRLARALGLSATELVHIQRGALLHDIGKMGVPDAILHKPGPLDDEEWSIMRKHPVYAYQTLAGIPFLSQALDIPYYHHEKWDGTGYPCELQGEHIPLAARIFAIVDIWDALRSDRPYRKGWPEERVRQHIRELSGAHLDPHIVDVFLELPIDL
jgi:HD-GYP domain-containing protein (c-di-GMP phosphodiesterase class II)